MRRSVIAIVALVVTMMLLCTTAGAGKKQKTPIVPEEKIVLWNGKDFAGWKLWVQDENFDVNKVWSVKDGVFRCEGQPTGYMRTETDYADYLLHVEWRWPEKGGNSGVLLHTNGPDQVWPENIEAQLQSGEAGDIVVLGGTETKEHAQKDKRVKGKKVIKLKDSSEKPLGQWNKYDIVCKDDWVVIFVNGVLQNVATRTSVTSGKICLQSEGTPIEFRNIYIEPVQ